MIIVRDIDVPEGKLREILAGMNIDRNSVLTLQDGMDPVKGGAEVILFITAMQNGWLGYHEKFFRLHCRNIQKWVVLLVNSDPVIYEQAVNGFNSEQARVFLHCIDSGTDFRDISAMVGRAVNVKDRKILLYSVRSDCGKEMLRNLLSDSLPDWSIEVSEDEIESGVLEKSDASHLIIVGKYLDDFRINFPEDISPIYVLTIPEENVQSYLHSDLLAKKLLDYIPSHLRWSEAMASQRLFYVSPLYEGWRRDQINPQYDDRFVMWDKFGLPVLREAYQEESVTSFLQQFNQVDKITELLKR